MCVFAFLQAARRGARFTSTRRALSPGCTTVLWRYQVRRPFSTRWRSAQITLYKFLVAVGPVKVHHSPQLVAGICSQLALLDLVKKILPTNIDLCVFLFRFCPHHFIQRPVTQRSVPRAKPCRTRPSQAIHQSTQYAEVNLTRSRVNVNLSCKVTRNSANSK